MNYILSLSNISAQNVDISGGKGANLARLIHHGFNVPVGYVITTKVFDENYPIEWETELSSLSLNGRYAVRSSSTAEDMPANSFAGQQDTYLNVSGFENIKKAINHCFASINNERALHYREKNGINTFSMAVVLQEMVDPDYSGVMFTADPSSSDRLTTIIEAVSGLGEELVSGRKIPTRYKIKNGNIQKSGENKISDEKIYELVQIGKNIQNSFGSEQDIEWCLKDNTFYIVQSRPITTLYPKPQSSDGFKRCYYSMGHLQMMTNTILPLGGEFLSRMMGTESPSFCGGRIYVDITRHLKSLFRRNLLLWEFKGFDKRIYDGVQEVLKRKEYIHSIPKGEFSFKLQKNIFPTIIMGWKTYIKNDLSVIQKYFMRMEGSIKELEKEIVSHHEGELVRFIERDIQTNLVKAFRDPIWGCISVARVIASYIKKKSEKYIGKNDIISEIGKSIPNNITSEMGIELGHIADIVRSQPELVDYLKNGGEDITKIGTEFSAFLNKYGCRCSGEIDITKPRYSEDPKALIAIILAELNQANGHANTIFERGLRESQKVIDELLMKANSNVLRKRIIFYRNFWGLREAPKYYMMRQFWIYKQALIEEAKRLEIRNIDDIYYMNFKELKSAFCGDEINYKKIDKMKIDYSHYEILNPPRIIFSDGEVIKTFHDTKAPNNSLVGIGVSKGTIIGRARVIVDVHNAKDIRQGEILVTRFTDPSWTPVFLSIIGLVTEVGGMVTHGSVVAREYGLPAVVGVDDATKLIRTGDMIRVNGEDGWVEILP